MEEEHACAYPKVQQVNCCEWRFIVMADPKQSMVNELRVTLFAIARPAQIAVIAIIAIFTCILLLPRGTCAEFEVESPVAMDISSTSRDCHRDLALHLLRAITSTRLHQHEQLFYTRVFAHCNALACPVLGYLLG